MKTISVVGAGMGGLAIALRLAHRGHRVVLFEKTDQVGGRNREFRVGECLFDAGPTLLMMLDPLRRLFADVGERLEDHLTIAPCDPLYRVFYRDGSRIDGTNDRDSMTRRIESLAGPRDAAAFTGMLSDLAALYEAAIPAFVRRNFYGPLDFFGGRNLALVARHRMLDNFARRIARYYEDPRVRMLFSFQSMYLGLSPYRARWVYATLTYMEYGEGIWHVKGGLAEIARAVARLAVARGAELRLETPVRRIHGRTVELESGERIEADAVICNADLPYAQRVLMDSKPRRRLRHSCSALMLYIDYEGELSALRHHNVFFGRDFRGNLEDIFDRGRLPDDPAFYACISARSDGSRSPCGHENLSVLVPCPNLERPWQAEDEDRLRSAVFRRLADETEFDPGRVRAMKTFSPIDWHSELNLEKGAAFGLSHQFSQSAYFRPGNRSRANSGVTFVGAGTVPGNGIPMVLISAELAEERLLRDSVI